MRNFLLLTMVVLFATSTVQAQALQNFRIFKNSETPKTETFKDAATEKFKIRKLIYDLNRYSNKHDLGKIKTFYSLEFKSGDGFSYDEFFKMADTTFNAYQDIKYNPKIKNIKIDNDRAAVKIIDKTTAKLVSSNNENSTVGDLEGICDYITYLKKESGKWKIISDLIVSEETALKYGDAKNVKMQVNAPQKVDKDSEYSISLQMDYPKDAFVIASLSREEITFPPTAQQNQESFRKLSPEGSLERLVRSNKDGINEYAVASIGFTRLKIGDDLASLKFQMSGLAFLMNRVNVNTNKIIEANQPEIAVDKNEELSAKQEIIQETTTSVEQQIIEATNIETTKEEVSEATKKEVVETAQDTVTKALTEPIKDASDEVLQTKKEEVTDPTIIPVSLIKETAVKAESVENNAAEAINETNKATPVMPEVSDAQKSTTVEPISENNKEGKAE